MEREKIIQLYEEFIANYDEKEKNTIWEKQSAQFKEFWEKKILSDSGASLEDSEIDNIVRILDYNAKGKQANAEVVAKTMITQDYWHKIFREIHKKPELKDVITNILNENNLDKKAEYIDLLYKINTTRNGLTGKMAVGINTFLVAYEPTNNLSVISQSHRKEICNYFGLEYDKNASIGQRIVQTNKVIIDFFDNLRISNNARTITRFLYCSNPNVYELWSIKKVKMNYWIFQGNPQVFDFETAIKDNLISDWTVTAHKNKINKGDKVIVWMTGKEAGCYALAEVTEEPREVNTSPDDHLWKIKNSNGTKAGIKITHNLIDNPIYKADIIDNEKLQNLKVGNQGTNFTATKEQYLTILNMIKNNSLFCNIKNRFNSSVFNNYIKYLRKINSELNLKGNDERVVYNARDDRLNFTVGQRYCFNLFLSNSKGTYGVISKDKLNDTSEPFDGNSPQPFYSYFTDFNPTSEQWGSIISAIKDELNRTSKSGYLKYNDLEFEKYVFWEKTNNIGVMRKMNFPLNTIFYGPPGTGKTYKSVLRAAEIIEDREIDTYDEALRIFKSELHKRIEFITFHQNYSYEDFIQGLRPDTDNKSSLVFDRKDGIFKIIADKALENLKLSEKAPEELSNEALFDKALEIFSDKILESENNYPINDTAYIFEVEEDAFRYTGDKWTNHTNGLRMKFSDLREFYRNNVKNRKDIKKLTSISGLANQHATYYFLVYDKILKLLPKKIENPQKIEQKDFVLIIDEINRANISRVFGELITLIEPDKRYHGKISMEAKLPSGDSFVVPSNLYIIGTMNTADKSIALLDIALRRRFEFEAMYPKYEIKDQEIYDIEILKRINEQIIRLKGHDFQVGHSYFMGENNDLVQRMNKKVIPLLLEYFMNDEKEVRGILQSAGLQIEENSWPIRITGKND